VTFGAPSSSIQSLEISIPRAPWPGFAYGFPTYSYTTTGGGLGSGSLPDTGGYFGKLFDFGDPANAGDVTLTSNVKPARRLTVCKQVLNNGDGVDNSGTFTINRGGNRDLTTVNLTATEGGSVVCSSTLGVANYGIPTQVLAQELSLPTNWPGNTPGFPLFNWTTTGGQSGSGTGNSVIFDLTNTPGVTGIENTTGDITVTFINRTGPPRVLTLCKEVEDNGDAILNQGGIFTLTGGGNAGTPGTFPLTQTEGQSRVCSPPITLDPLATTISASETAPGTWPGNAFGYPQWTLLDGANATVTAGTGTPTGNLLLNSFTGNPTIVFRNRATLAETGICVDPPSGLVSWWPLNGNAIDIKGSNSGAIEGSGHSFPAAKVSQGWKPGALGSDIRVNDANSLDLTTFTIETWVKVDAVTVPNMTIVWKGNTAGADLSTAYYLGVLGTSEGANQGKVASTISNGTIKQTIISSAPLPLGSFNHLAVTADGTNLKLYINGTLDQTLAQTLIPQNTTHPLQIGGVSGTSFISFNGLIDELALYNRALTVGEILSIVTTGSAGKCGNTPPTITVGAVTRQQGSPSGPAVNIATVSDAEDAVGSLSVAIIPGGTATGITLGTLTNNNGTVGLTVAASCTATAGTVRLQVTDSGGLTATSDLQVSVNANSAPILAYNNQTVVTSQPLTVSPVAGPGDNGSVNSIVVLSPGTYTGMISVDNTTGVVSLGNAKPAGNHTITLQATDNCGVTTDASFTLNVTCPAITVGPATISGGTVGLPYLPTSFSATGGNGSVTFSLSGTLPTGMSLVNGQLAGTPTQQGSFPITVTATDAYNCSASKQYTLTVSCPTIVISHNTLPIAQISEAYLAQTFTASGGNEPYTVSQTGALPAGMSFSGSTLSGTPTVPGNFPITINVTDQYGCTASRNLTLKVNRSRRTRCVRPPPTSTTARVIPTAIRWRSRKRLPGLTRWARTP
jgi:hypothetical protein